MPVRLPSAICTAARMLLPRSFVQSSQAECMIAAKARRAIDDFCPPNGTQIAAFCFDEIERWTMQNFIKINEDVLVGPQPSGEEFKYLQHEGVKSVVNFRHEGEDHQTLSP